jgi:threonine-phosphate decarboxylase
MRQIPWTSDPAPLFRHGDAAGRGRDGWLDYSVSVNPLGPPSTVLLALRDHAAQAVAHYPDPGCRDLASRLAARHDVPAANVVVGNGANDLLFAAARAFRPRRTVVVEPAYTEYLRASLAAGADVEHWLADGDGFEPQPFDIQGADLVWLANPNNPTGRLWPPGCLAPWIEAHPRTLFVVDEAFLPLRPDESDHSLVPAVSRLANLVVVRSLTKLYTLPGLRLGYALAGAERASGLRAAIVPWSVNALAQVAGLAALEDDAFLAQTHAWFRHEAESFAGRLRACSGRLDVVPSGANFVLARLKGTTAAWLARRLAEQRCVVREAGNFVGLDEHFVRVAVRGPDDNRRLLDTLATLLEG